MNWISRVGTSLAVAAGLAYAAPASATVYYVQTFQAGAQTGIDVNNSKTWAITPVGDFDLGGGDFVMKIGSATTTAISLVLHDADNANAVLASLIYTSTEFCTAHGGNCQNFANTPFHFTTPVSLVTGHNYVLELISPPSPDPQSAAYFIKSSSGDFIPLGTPPNGEPPVQPPLDPPQVPEPASLALLGMGLLGLGMARRRR